MQLGSEHVVKLIVAVVLIGSTVYTFVKAVTLDPGYMERITVTDDISAEPAKAEFIAKLSRRLALGSSLKVCEQEIFLSLPNQLIARFVPRV